MLTNSRKVDNVLNEQKKIKIFNDLARNFNIFNIYSLFKTTDKYKLKTIT